MSDVMQLIKPPQLCTNPQPPSLYWKLPIKPYKNCHVLQTHNPNYTTQSNIINVQNLHINLIYDLITLESHFCPTNIIYKTSSNKVIFLISVWYLECQWKDNRKLWTGLRIGFPLHYQHHICVPMCETLVFKVSGSPSCRVFRMTLDVYNAKQTTQARNLFHGVHNIA